MDINRLCLSCMREKNAQGVPCPFCGFDENKTPNPQGMLPLWSVLQGAYLIGRVLGDGGFGITYCGYDMNLQKKVAIKEYFPYQIATRDANGHKVRCADARYLSFFDAEKERFVDEARILAGLEKQQGVVNVIYFFYENKTAYIVMEYVEGESLLRHMAGSGGRLPVAQAKELLKGVLAALAGVHKKGVVHKDISPDNILITPEGKARLIDFGASFRKGEGGERLKVYKESYSPPEQIEGRDDVGAWSDVYAFAATFYHCITGVKPLSAIHRKHKDTLQAPSMMGISIDALTEAALMNALEPDPKERIRDAADLYYFLYRYGQEQQATPERMKQKIREAAPEMLLRKIAAEKKRDRNVRYILMGGICVLVIGLALILMRTLADVNRRAQTGATGVTTQQEQTQTAASAELRHTTAQAPAYARPSAEELNTLRETLYACLQDYRAANGVQDAAIDGALEQAATDCVAPLLILSLDTTQEWNDAISESAYRALGENRCKDTGWAVLPVHGQEPAEEVFDGLLAMIDAANASIADPIDLVRCRQCGIAIGVHEDGTLFYALLYR